MAVKRPDKSSDREPLATDRLDSWKEIASYLRRSERTVRRWEHALHLPVRRVVASKRATVFALKSELDDWWRECGQDANGAVERPNSSAARRSLVWFWMGGFLVAAAALLVMPAVVLRPIRPARPVWKQITFDTGWTSEPAISRDGKWIVYSSDRTRRGDGDIYAQRLAGGEVTRLTYHEARDCRPDISPDGSRVAFHSYRDGGGIYTIPTSGGKETWLAGGDYPRFSPDGTRVAFDNELPDGTFAIFTVSVTGGPVRRVTPPTFRLAREPLWSRDGKRILFIGSTKARPQEDDWWAVPADGGDPIRTGVSEQLVRQGWQGLRFYHPPLDWNGDRIIFFYSGWGNGNLWQIPLSRGTLQVAGRAEQVTSGMGRETHVRVAPGGGLERITVAAAGTHETHQWEFSIDQENGVVSEGGRQLTNDTSMMASLTATRPSLSANADLLVYASRRSGNYDVWLQDLRTGAERPLAASLQDELDPILAPDGSAVAFMRLDGAKQPVFTVTVDGRQTRQVCDDCGRPTDWSSDGRYVLYLSKAAKLGLLDLNTGARSELPSSAAVLSGTFSPDRRTIAVGTRLGEIERAYLLPFEDRGWPTEAQWKPLSQQSASAVIWSASGRLAYFLSIEDEYRCLWAQRLDPRTRQTIGRPFAVKHFHTMAQYPQMSRWLAIARNKLILRLTRERSNIWLTELN